ncbi:hypothetical protein DMB90_11980 [Raoultella planticola]|uniref:Peptidase C39 domain-containing protein n=1 Tax=Raoultella planticola TaxID=575 RepID=A0A5P6A9W7_RAOPL|nr:hypothetical protein DMB90_11980 [Raoultella planticola]
MMRTMPGWLYRWLPRKRRRKTGEQPLAISGAALCHRMIIYGRARLIARYHGTAVNIRALREQFFVDAEHHITLQLVRAARHCGFRCRYYPHLHVTSRLPLPALVHLSDRGYSVLLAVKDGQWLVQEIDRPQPSVYSPVEGPGSAVLFSQRFSVEKLANEFNLRWFWQAFMQYRRLVGEVLLASFLFNCWH